MNAKKHKALLTLLETSNFLNLTFTIKGTMDPTEIFAIEERSRYAVRDLFGSLSLSTLSY